MSVLRHCGAVVIKGEIGNPLKSSAWLVLPPDCSWQYLETFLAVEKCRWHLEVRGGAKHPAVHKGSLHKTNIQPKMTVEPAYLLGNLATCQREVQKTREWSFPELNV